MIRTIPHHLKDTPMSLSIYDIAIAPLLAGLSTLSRYLDKAEAYAADNKIDPTVLVNARLAPDMLPLAGQVQRASDSAKAAVGRLTGLTVPSFADTETTLAELKERVAKTVAFLKSVPKEKFDGGESRPVELKFTEFAKTFRGDEFALGFLLPNFLFHVAMAHAILRHNGMKIGKADYLANFTGAVG
jgi:hypothetical protein